MNKNIMFGMKIFLAVLTMSLAVCLSACGGQTETKFAEYEYGVFLGADEITDSMSRYDLLVLDADAVSANQISELQASGSRVYTYLNVGTVEMYRDYYDTFDKLGLLLDVYSDWPDERFIDVSDKRWQDYVVCSIAKNLTATGIDGFFLDNFDVYDEYDCQAKFLEGLIAILRMLKNTYKLPIMINGGDVAVKEIIKDNADLIDAVNQECVFTGIDFDNDVLTVQDAETKEYYQDYLKRCKDSDIDVYLLEYGGKILRKTIDDYCKQNGYKYYISKDLDLTQAL